MTHLLTRPQNEALAALNAALYHATNTGLLDKLAVDLHPDTINRFCEGVGQFCTQAQERPGAKQPAESHHVPEGYATDSFITVSKGQALLPNSEVVDLLKVQASLNFAFQETGDHEFMEATDELSKVTGMWQGPHGAFLPNDLETVAA